MSEARRLIGHVYMALRPCGRYSAMAWDEDSAKKDIGKSVARWIARGDTVERIARYEGDPIPELIAGCAICKGDEKVCRETAKEAA